MFRSRWLAAALAFAVTTASAATRPTPDAQGGQPKRMPDVSPDRGGPPAPNGALPVDPAWAGVAVRIAARRAPSTN